MKRIISIILSAVVLNSCVHLTVVNSQQAPSRPGDVVCSNVKVRDLKNYNKPSVPNVDTIAVGDTEGEILMLLDYIDSLRTDIDRYIIDYDCR